MAKPPTNYERSEREQTAVAQWQDRLHQAVPLPRFTWSATGGLTYAHPDQETAQFLIMSAIGVTDVGEYLALLQQAASFTQKDGAPDVEAVQAIFAFVAGMKPQNSVEAMLAFQMAAIHDATMVSARRLHGSENLAQLDSHGTALNKLARTFSMQAETLKKLRSGGPQRVVVEHKHYHLHQAPEEGTGGGVHTETEHQSHVRSLPEREAMLGYVEADQAEVQRAGGDRV